jgi:predicted amino acid racemase
MPLYLDQLETPAAVVDLDRLALNLDRMAAYCAVHGLRLRPHVKTHKAPRIAAEQLRLGAAGLTVATVREAEVMSELTDDLLLAYPLVGATALRRFTNIAPSVRLTVALDSRAAAERLAAAAGEIGRAVHVLVEVDVGMRRTGVAGPAAACELAAFVADQAPLRYDGIAFYPGHVRQATHAQAPAMAGVVRRVEATLEALARAGHPADAVSGGSTPAAWRMHEIPGLTEVRPGTYVYNDRVTAAIGACEWDACAVHRARHRGEHERGRAGGDRRGEQGVRPRADGPHARRRRAPARRGGRPRRRGGPGRRRLAGRGPRRRLRRAARPPRGGGVAHERGARRARPVAHRVAPRGGRPRARGAQPRVRGGAHERRGVRRARRRGRDAVGRGGARARRARGGPGVVAGRTAAGRT